MPAILSAFETGANAVTTRARARGFVCVRAWVSTHLVAVALGLALISVHAGFGFHVRDGLGQGPPLRHDGVAAREGEESGALVCVC